MCPSLRTASPALATATSEHGYGNSQGGTTDASDSPACSATLILINNPDLKVTPFVLGEDFASTDVAITDRESSLLRKDDAIEDAVARALEQRASSCDDGVTGNGSGGASSPVGQFGSICLAFGGGSSADGGNAECMSQLRRLNAILRRARPTSGTNVVIDGGGSGSGSVGSVGECKRCPLVASATMTDAGDETIVSTWDERRGTFRTAAGAVVGALVSASPESTTTAFQLVHAGDHVPLRGSQFRIKRMQGGDIVEVMPVRPLTADEHMRPRCGDGAIAAADWCRDAVVASTWFEKLAMQSALGVGVLRRVNHDSRTRNCHILSKEALHQEGVIPYFPADACIGIAEVETGGSLLLTPPCSGDTLAEHVHPSGFTWRGGAATAGAEAAATTVKGLRPGDLCDFRAIGSLATIQAEHDAYAWLHAARLSASILRPASSNENGDPSGAGDSTTTSSSGVQGIQGCFSAGAASRFGREYVQEGCDGVASAAAEHGGCPAVGIVPGMQIVSVDNEMVTCSTNACLASVYVCGQVGPDCC